MNVLRDLYNDGHYEAYLHTSPTLAVAVVGGDALKFEQVLLHPAPGRLPLCTVSVPSVEAIKPKKVKRAPRADYFLKSRWCLKHQTESFSCIVLPLPWDNWEGKREQEKNVLPLLEKTKSQVRSLQCKVVVACTTAKPTSPTRLAAFQDAIHTMKIILGSHFACAVLLPHTCDDAKSAAELVDAVLKAGVDFHTQEIARLNAKRRDLTFENRDRGVDVVNAAVARTYFQIGWHQLVLHKYSEAAQSFFKACRVCRSMYPRFPPFEARIAVTVFLRHILDVLSKCNEVFTYGSPAHAQVTQMVDWLKTAYPSIDASQRGKKVLRALQLFLEAEWCEHLARRTENIDSHIRSDYLFSSACCLNDALSFLPTASEKLEVPSPETIGAEYHSDTYVSVILSGCSRQTIAAKISNLIAECCAPPSKTQGFEAPAFRSLLLDVTRQTTVSTEFAHVHLSTLLQQWPAVLSIFNGYLYQTALRVLDETAILEDIPAEMICKLLVSGCVDPVRPVTQPVFCDVLQRLTTCTPLLEYPHGCLLPPVGLSLECETTECVAAVGRIAVLVSLFTTSLTDIHVDNIQVEMQSVTDVDKNSVSEIIVGRCSDTSIIVPGFSKGDTKCTAKVYLAFPKPGKYMCSKVFCDAKLSGVTVPIVLHAGSRFSDTKTKRSLFTNGSEVIRVRLPSSLLTVDGPNVVEAVEGETIELNVTICSTDGNLTEGNLVVPDTGSFFEIESDHSSHYTLPNAEQTRTHELPNVCADAPSIFSVRGQCARSGYFTIPLRFQYKNRDNVVVETTKTIRVIIDPPFDVHFSCANGVRWSTEDAVGSTLFPPASSAIHIRKDMNILEDATDSLPGVKGLGTKFFYCIRTDDNGFSTSSHIPFEENGTMTVIASLICRAKNGLTVSKADFVCNDHIELQYVSYGLLPCGLEAGDSVTVVAQFRAKKKMESFLPGFLRILFSPQNKSASRLFTDLGLPSMTVVSNPVQVSTAYPPVVTFSQPFVVCISIKNTLLSPFQGDLTLDTRTELFALGGRVQWTFLLGPHEEKSTELLLTPLIHGSCPLPHFQIRDTSTGRIVATNRDRRLVTVL